MSQIEDELNELGHAVQNEISYIPVTTTVCEYNFLDKRKYVLIVRQPETERYPLMTEECLVNSEINKDEHDITRFYLNVSWDQFKYMEKIIKGKYGKDNPNFWDSNSGWLLIYLFIDLTGIMFERQLDRIREFYKNQSLAINRKFFKDNETLIK